MELLVEIGTEEIPALFIVKALDDLKEITRNKFTSHRLGFEDMMTLGTPRRILLYVKGLGESQRDEVIRAVGPARRVAFDKEGRPTQAAMGFARRHGVTVNEIKFTSTEKGEYICIEKEVKGRKTKDILTGVLFEVIDSLTFPKSMRWGSSSIAFARPIHWILAIADGEVVPFTYGSIKSGSSTRGHPFLSPEPIEVHSFNEYKEGLRRAHVIVDQREREKIIRNGIDRASREVGGIIYEDEELIKEVTYLVENPVVIRGSFPERFLELPKEVLIHAMKEHQRYFAVIDNDGNLLPYFVAIANTPGRDTSIITEGNERVLRARLEDARFFFEVDKKVTLDERVEELKGVVYQSKLGTSYEKMMRFRRLANIIVKEVCPEKESIVDRVAYLCKGDLLTEMVGEFPGLQGIMGRAYALLSGEDPEIAQGIYEHYLPVTAGDEIPEGIAGAVISIADKLDTILGCFSIGIIPTGTADPYALRRQALGIINIILGKGWRLSLEKLLDQGLDLLEDKRERKRELIKEEVKEFLRLRFHHQLTSEGFSNDVVDAVLSSEWDDLVDAVRRIEALESFKKTSGYKSLCLTVKRVINITKGARPCKIENKLMKEDAEIALYNFFLERKNVLDRLFLECRYNDALNEMLQFQCPVDSFFDNVMVMVDDKGLRDNRLSLLAAIGRLFHRIGDFSKLIISEKT